jgi:Uma2 family endonuclease
MATSTALISIEEYLRTMYHPDCDFVDGHIEERNLGEYEHGVVQTEVARWFSNRGVEWNIRAITEQRTRVSEDRVRIPDITVIRRDAPREAVRFTPALLCIEVLSPEDRLSRTARIMDEYLQMGVPNLWIVDPIRRAAYTYGIDGLHQVAGDRISIPGTLIFLDLPSIYAELD